MCTTWQQALKQGPCVDTLAVTSDSANGGANAVYFPPANISRSEVFAAARALRPNKPMGGARSDCRGRRPSRREGSKWARDYDRLECLRGPEGLCTNLSVRGQHTVLTYLHVEDLASVRPLLILPCM
jgi:hypothetical protein